MHAKCVTGIRILTSNKWCGKIIFTAKKETGRKYRKKVIVIYVHGTIIVYRTSLKSHNFCQHNFSISQNTMYCGGEPELV